LNRVYFYGGIGTEFIGTADFFPGEIFGGEDVADPESLPHFMAVTDNETAAFDLLFGKSGDPELQMSGRISFVLPECFITEYLQRYCRTDECGQQQP
jgi:hypothetical protein